jgi:N-acylneuraminate cytidylyltransferase
VIKNQRVLAIVPARGGSREIPFKNIASCAGKPLIAWTLEAARESKYIDQIIVSTDSLAISQVAMKHGCSAAVSRPPELATDDAPMDGVVLHALDAFPGYDIAVLLQPTSPLRTATDIDGALELLTDSVVSVHESYVVPFTGEDPPRRQDRKPTLYLNGAIYAFRVDWFRKTRKFVAPESVPYVIPATRAVDVDYPIDMALAATVISMTTSADAPDSK